MARHSEQPRFPYSLNLFKFCFRVLESRRPNAKIHDQDLGEIMGFNPSDTSHWKRGKKSVRNIPALEKVSKFLDVEIEIVQDIADGRLEVDEAWSDFQDLEAEKQWAQENPAAKSDRKKLVREIEKLTEKILADARASSSPIHIPEVLQQFSHIHLVPAEVSQKLARSSRVKPGQYAIRYQKGEQRPHTRIAIAKELGRILLHSEDAVEQRSYGDSQFLFHAEIIEFANALLMPRELLMKEIAQVPSSINFVTLLAETFWVPKTAVRSRLVSLLLDQVPLEAFQAPALSVQKFVNPQEISPSPRSHSTEVLQ